MDKSLLVGALKSKTINLNVAITVLLVWGANAYGIPMTPEVATAATAAIYGVMNVILRFVTNKPLPEKGFTIPNPAYVQGFVKTLEENPEVVAELHKVMKDWVQKDKIEKKVKAELNKR